MLWQKLGIDSGTAGCGTSMHGPLTVLCLEFSWQLTGCMTRELLSSTDFQLELRQGCLNTPRLAGKTTPSSRP